jgi:NADH-quinone oxidoreductase subunit J
MLVGVDASDSLVETLPGQRVFAYLFGLVFAGAIMFALSGVDYGEAVGLTAAQDEGSVTGLAREIFTRQVFGFEILGTLLVIAVMGAMVLAHHERLTPALSQRSRADQTIARGTWLAGKPNPGVYARHNAADTPALLPDGTPSEDSVPRVLVARGQMASIEGYSTSTEQAYDAIGYRDGHNGAAHVEGVGEPEDGAEGQDTGSAGAQR